MEDVIDVEIIKTTQASLGKYVKRPPLTEKLLKKPPFRFLHDIVTSVLKSTGFFSGLFEDVELVSDNVKDRESKVLFLTKVISVVGTTTGKSLTVKPTKIVAGQEPEKTNELLQSLAFALDNKLSSDEAVKLYKESAKNNASSEKKVRDISKSIKKVPDTKKLTSKSTEKLIKTEKNSNKTKVKENSLIKKDSPPKKTSQSSKIINKKVTEKEKQEVPIIATLTNSESSTIKNPDVVSKEEAKQTSVDASPSINNLNLEITDNNEHSAPINSNVDNAIFFIEDSQNLKVKEVNAPVSKENIINEPSNKHNDTTREINENTYEHVSNENEIISKKNTSLESNSDDINENLHKQDKVITGYAQPEVNATDAKVVSATSTKRPNSVRPSSSRPGAPRFRDKHEVILSAVDNLVVGKVNIIAENTTNEEEEESSIVIVENTETNLQNDEDQLENSNTQHGHLVQQILNAQKEFSEVNGKTNIEWQFGTQKAKDVINQEIEQLRFNVQALSRVANPLGKLLDHVQEDVEVMRQELQQWTKIYEDTSKQLLKQKASNEELLFPLHSKVKQLEGEIAEKYDKINDLKIVIHKNTSRIEKLLASGNVQ
ncbi:unnamed protein product [Euphydryas editha]|uniref:TRAF3-interacting protein 1 n=1 Tax=Euphydryas editha TaxID=104508 RepID=A0AAU9UA28_EUPED|nr:unnamed protein product [Euphydryas editha]